MSDELRDEIATTVYDKGAYCGECSYEGWDECSQCRRITRGYADALLPLVANVRADALREAADDLPWTDDVRGWLCDRADRIEAGDAR